MATLAAPYPMKTIEVTCQICNKQFNAPLKEVKRGNSKYCSRICSNLGVSKTRLLKGNLTKEHNTKCEYCGKTFYRNKSKKSLSKSGIYFCCRNHKDLGQRIEANIKDIQPSHYGKSDPSNSNRYRKLAFRYLELKCNKCGYDKYPNILEVHHKDLNRNNESISNLEILCSRCHDEFHYLTKTGKWSE